MIELLILACIAVVMLGGAIARQGVEHGRTLDAIARSRVDDQLAAQAERQAWRDERRFLIDRIISRHVGEIVALEREDTHKQEQGYEAGERPVRPLLEGLS